MATRPLWLAGLAAVVMAACSSAEPPPRSPEPPPPAAPEPIAEKRVAPPPATTARPEPAPPPPPVATAKKDPEPATSATTDPPAAPEKTTTAGPDEVPGANLRMGGMTADGVQLSDIQCRTEGGAVGGLLGGLTVAAGFKARKAQLDACAPKGAVETRVRWTAAGGRMTGVKASGPDAKVNRCVEKALTGAPGTLEGACAATARHGKP